MKYNNRAQQCHTGQTNVKWIKKNAKSVSSADVHSYIFIPAVAIWPLGQCLFVCLA